MGGRDQEPGFAQRMRRRFFRLLGLLVILVVAAVVLYKLGLLDRLEPEKYVARLPQPIGEALGQPGTWASGASPVEPESGDRLSQAPLKVAQHLTVERHEQAFTRPLTITNPFGRISGGVLKESVQGKELLLPLIVTNTDPDTPYLVEATWEIEAEITPEDLGLSGASRFPIPSEWQQRTWRRLISPGESIRPDGEGETLETALYLRRPLWPGREWELGNGSIPPFQVTLRLLTTAEEPVAGSQTRITIPVDPE